MVDRPKTSERLLASNPFLKATVDSTNQALEHAFGLRPRFSPDNRARNLTSLRFRPQEDIDKARRQQAPANNLLAAEARSVSLPLELFIPDGGTPCIRVGQELLVSDALAVGLQAPVSRDSLPQLVSYSHSLFALLSDAALESAPKPVEVTDVSIMRFYADKFQQEITEIASGHPQHHPRFARLTEVLKTRLSKPGVLRLTALGSRLRLELDGKIVIEQFRGDDHVATELLIQEASVEFVQLMNGRYPAFGSQWKNHPSRHIRPKDKERALYTINALLEKNPHVTTFGLYVSSTLGTVNADFTGRALAARIAREKEESRPIRLTSLAGLADVFGVAPIDEADADVRRFDYANYFEREDDDFQARDKSRIPRERNFPRLQPRKVYSDTDPHDFSPDSDIEDPEVEEPTRRRKKLRPTESKPLE